MDVQKNESLKNIESLGKIVFRAFNTKEQQAVVCRPCNDMTGQLYTGQGKTGYFEGLTVKDKEGLTKTFRNIFYCSCGSQGGIFQRVGQLYSEVAAIAKVKPGAIREVTEGQDNIIDAMPLQVFDHMFKEWPVGNRHHGLGRIQSKGAQPRSFTTDQKNRLHFF